MKILSYTERNKRKQNQDSFYWSEWSDSTVILAVADGMGGLTDGLETSTRLLQLVQAQSPDLGTLASSLENFSATLKNTGSTLDVVKLCQGSFTIFHLGDSRVYWVDSEGRLEQVTTDHSVLADLEKARPLTPEDFEKYAGLLSRGVGKTPYSPPDVLQGFVPDYAIGVLVCSDGFWQALRGEVVLTNEGLHEIAMQGIERGVTDNMTCVLGVFDA